MAKRKKTKARKREKRRTVGDAIRAAREQAGLSQIALANLIGVSASGLNRIENGPTLPSLPTAMALADALQVPLDELCGLSPLTENQARLELSRLKALLNR